MKKALSLLLLLALCLSLVPAAAEESRRILCPSENESVIVPGRDFDVVAFVPADAHSATVRLLNAAGETVRLLTGTDAPQFDLTVEGLNAFNAEQAEYWMPDLIYEPDRPDSLYDGSIKCYLKNGMLFAVVAGGYYRMNGREIVDQEGQPYAPLTEGSYTLEVTAGDTVLTAPLTLGTTVRKVMARFTPEPHMRVVGSTAAEAGVRTYTDPLPGYWSPSSFIPGQESNPYFAELKDRWQLADSMEYYGGEIHFYIYNLSAGCATVAVELAALQRDGAVDTRVKAYHYDIGEPLLGYPESETGAYLLGKLVPFAPGDRLAFPRAEVTDAAEDNVYVAYTGDARPIDLNVADGLTVPAGKALTLFGVARPIQNDPADLKQLTESAWEIGNRISQIEYDFSCGDERWTERREVGLNRALAEGWNGYSLYEFAHTFVFDAARAGQTLAVTARGIDAHGQAVPGAEEAFSIEVR